MGYRPLRVAFENNNAPIVHVLLHHNRAIVSNVDLTMQQKNRFNDHRFSNLLISTIKQIDKNIHMTALIRKRIDNVIKQLSTYEKYKILLDPNLAKQIGDIIKNKASVQEITNGMLQCLALDPKKKIIEDLSNYMMQLTLSPKAHWSYAIIRPKIKTIKKDKIETILLALHTLGYDTLKSKKEEIKNKIFDTSRSTHSVDDMVNQLHAYISKLHKPNLRTKQDDQVTNKLHARSNRSPSVCG